MAGPGAFSRRVSTASCGEIFCFDSGEPKELSRRAFVLVHGLGDEADTWRHVFPLIARQARVLALDLPGFGRSLTRRRATLGYSARALLEFLDATAPGEVVLVGSSMGAVVSQLALARERRLAARERRGSRIRALCLVDGGLPGLQAAPGTWRSILPILGERGYTYLSTRPDRAYASLRPYYSDLDALSAADRDFLRERAAARVTSATQKRAYFSLFRDLGLWVGLPFALLRPRSSRPSLAPSSWPGARRTTSTCRAPLPPSSAWLGTGRGSCLKARATCPSRSVPRPSRPPSSIGRAEAKQEV